MMNYAGTTNQNLVFMYMKAYFAHYVNTVNQRYQNSFTTDPDLRLTVRLTNFLFITVFYYYLLLLKLIITIFNLNSQVVIVNGQMQQMLAHHYIQLIMADLYYLLIPH
jgi:hypothetical protein